MQQHGVTVERRQVRKRRKCRHLKLLYIYHKRHFIVNFTDNIFKKSSGGLSFYHFDM
eukprot:m.279242 g.279242  ORF g.279242 m.279242 type:complete len:57 (-) comp16321_c1_seq4:2772-2942(-)